MNRTRLQQIFTNYIKKFEIINSPKCDENYKWRVASKFRELMNPEHPDFAERIKEAGKVSANLIDSSNRYCFSSLINCASIEPESVRALFKELFSDDGGDLTVRQNKILKFIEEANTLTRRLVSSNGMFMNDQRSAMGYLFLYDPDQHYLYKASEATDFASCIEFYDDWGPGTAFRLDVYYRMCDMLVEEIRKCEALKETHASRYRDKNGNPILDMHPDKNYHILAFDIIYGAPEFRYNFYSGITFSTITSQARKLHQDRVAKARLRQEALSVAKAKSERLAEAKTYFSSVLVTGVTVKHKLFGTGKILSTDEKSITVTFFQNGDTKKLDSIFSLANGFLTADIADITGKIALYREVIMEERNIENALIRAQAEFDEYKEFLE